MAASLELTILQLLMPNNESLSQGFSSMREAFKDPGINLALCECMTNTQIPQVRQYCAVLLRKKISKAKQWKRVPEQVKQGIKQTVLELFVKESEHCVLTAITELLATIAKHEFAQKKWPELMQFLHTCIESNNSKEKEVGLYALSIITGTVGQSLKPYLKILLCLLSKTLLDTSNPKIPFFTIVCLTNLVNLIGTEEMNVLQSLVPYILQVVKNLAAIDQENTCKVMEIFDALVESEVAVIVPHIKPLIGLCLELAGNSNLESNIRVKALHIISWMTRLKKKTILKHKLISPILDSLFPIMCQDIPADNSEEIDEFDNFKEINETSPCSMAGQVIDTMALYLPPEKLIPPLMHHMDAALKHENPYYRKAAYLTLAVIAEGCSEYIKNKCLQSYLQVICRGIQEENSIVRNAALYSLGQFAEYLQPDISKFASDLIPVLLTYLQTLCQNLKDDNNHSPSLMKTFYALETFCENLENDLVPFLPLLMEKLMMFMNAKSDTIKELAISAIGSVASSAKESFVPYFTTVIDTLKVFISQKSEENLALKIQAIDTLSLIAKAVGPSVFLPMANDCTILGLELIDQVDDPDLRRCIYNLFSAVSSILKEDMSKYLTTVIEHMIGSILSCEGISTQYVLNDDPSFTLFEDLDGEDDDKSEDLEEESAESEDEEIAGFTVENAYMDEKEAACVALKEIASNVQIPFIPYLDKCFNEIKKLIESPACDVRREAVGCLGQFCITLNAAFLKTGSLEYRLELDQKQNAFLPKLFTAAREDTERRVVLACLETLQEMIEKIKSNFIFNNTLENIVVLIKDVFKHKLACQDDEEDEEIDDQEAEYDTMLFEYAGDLIPALVKTVPWKQFAPYFAGLLPFILPRTKPSCSVSDKSFSIGTLAEVVSQMEIGASKPFVAHLLNVFLKGMNDEDEEVRSNAVFGLGALVQNATDSVYDQYPSLLQALSNMLAKEDSARARDNLCSAVAKMIIVNTPAIPLKDVFPAFLMRLPLQVDMDENVVVYGCLSHLYQIKSEEFFQSFPNVLKILAEALSKQKLDNKSQCIIAKLLQSIYKDFPADFDSTVSNFPQPYQDALRTALAQKIGCS